jgi:transposase
VRCAGIEGTSSYGAGLFRYLKAAGVSVVEVERPKRRHLRRKGKSDPIDAEAAARAVLAGEALGEPKSGDGRVEMIRTLRSARQSAVKASTQAANQLKALLVTAPEELRHRLRKLPTKELVATCARFRPGDDPDNIETATRFALRSVARRHETLSEEISELDAQLDRLVAEVAPGLISLPAIGTHHAATLLVVAGDNPERLRSEASFSLLDHHEATTDSSCEPPLGDGHRVGLDYKSVTPLESIVGDSVHDGVRPLGPALRSVDRSCGGFAPADWTKPVGALTGPWGDRAL